MFRGIGGTQWQVAELCFWAVYVTLTTPRHHLPDASQIERLQCSGVVLEVEVAVNDIKKTGILANRKSCGEINRIERRSNALAGGSAANRAEQE
jgi:hypothetical protein